MQISTLFRHTNLLTNFYWIGKYEVTAGQYAELLNAVADADPVGLYSTSMGSGFGGQALLDNLLNLRNLWTKKTIRRLHR